MVLQTHDDQADPVATGVGVGQLAINRLQCVGEREVGGVAGPETEPEATVLRPGRLAILAPALYGKLPGDVESVGLMPAG